MTFEESRKFAHERGYKSVFMTEHEQRIDYEAFVFGWNSREQTLVKNIPDKERIKQKAVSRYDSFYEPDIGSQTDAFVSGANWAVAEISNIKNNE